MSMDNDNYGECLYCAGRVWLNHTGSFFVVSPEDGGGYLHRGKAVWECREMYEKDNGAIHCEGDLTPDDDPCDHCAGKGWRWASGAKSEDDGEKCEACKGTGVQCGERYTQEDDGATLERIDTTNKMFDLMDALSPHVAQARAWTEKHIAKGRR